MSFSAFSNEFHANMFTNVENAFITKYLPWADGDAVRVYLYGLYLCSRQEELSAESAAKLLKLSLEKLREIYRFWEECGLVHILSEDPLRLEYLPVSASFGKPKPIRPEKYTEFNRELFRRLQRIGRDPKPYEMQKILDFLENNEMEPQAFLLVVEYCINADGNFSLSHVLGKANKLVRENKFTYEQIENDLADFNENEDLLQKIFSRLGIYRKARESDLEVLENWKKSGILKEVILSCANSMKKGTLKSLDALLKELGEKGIHTLPDAQNYLKKREDSAELVFALARKLGVKVENPRAYSEEYAEKWESRGYTKESLLSLAALCFKLGFGFPEMDALLEKLYEEKIADGEAVKKYCLAREEALKLLLSVQTICSSVKKTQSALDTISEWREWGFSDQMILAAAKRSTEAAAPLSYMNRLLNDWKKEGIFSPAEIPQKGSKAVKETYREIAIASDKRTDREHFYAVRRQAALSVAEKNKARAEEDAEFKESTAVLKRGEIELAKAELYAPKTLPDILLKMQEANEKRKRALQRLGLSEKDFEPQFVCPLCSDTGFLPNGLPCDCYPE